MTSCKEHRSPHGKVQARVIKWTIGHAQSAVAGGGSPLGRPAVQTKGRGAVTQIHAGYRCPGTRHDSQRVRVDRGVDPAIRKQARACSHASPPPV